MAAAKITKPATITADSVATRAYTLWEEAGRPLGQDTHHWLMAERALLEEFATPIANATSKPASKRKPARRTATKRVRKAA